ncbi:MAG: M24 family metallopeptidase [Parachlamydiaceae bacterium]
MDYQGRIQRLKQRLAHQSLLPALVTNLTDIFYLTGLQLSAGKMVITPQNATLIVDGRYIEKCQADSPIPVLLSDKNALWKCLKSQSLLAVDSEEMTYQSFIDLQREADERAISLKPVKGLFTGLRAIKDRQEIQRLKESALLCVQGFDHVFNLLSEGITEEAVAQELELFWKKQRRTSLSFDPIIAFGASASMPHYRVGKRALKKGDIVLVDIGVELNGYHSDMTRVVFFGDIRDELREIYDVVYTAFQKAVSVCHPGMLIGELDEVARSIVREAGYGDHFNHSLGHGIGLEVHEYPIIKQTLPSAELPLQAGMVITIEPGIYLPQIGGVRLEDTVLINETGCESLTPCSYLHRKYV